MGEDNLIEKSRGGETKAEDENNIKQCGAAPDAIISIIRGGFQASQHEKQHCSSFIFRRDHDHVRSKKKIAVRNRPSDDYTPI